MTPEELTALLGPMLAEAVKPLADRLDQVEKDTKASTDTLAASSSVRAMVEPHCAALESAAAAMDAAGVGTDATRGHVQFLRRMSDSMRAEAAVGKVPHIFRDHDYPYYASREPTQQEADLTKDEVTKLVAEAVAAAVKPLQDELKSANDKLVAQDTQLKDAQNLRRLDATAPVRKTVVPQVASLLSRAGIVPPEEDKKLVAYDVDKALAGANLNIQQRIMVKNELGRIGAL